MKAETQRERAEFAAQLRVYSRKDPPLLTTEAINDMSAVLHEDSKTRRRVRELLKKALATGSVLERVEFVQAALKELED